MTQTKLVDVLSDDSIVLSDGMLYEQEHDWSPVVGQATRTLSGAIVLQEHRRVGGRPVTLKSLPNHGWLKRQVLNQLRDARDKSGEYWLYYLADGESKRLKVVFDSTQKAIVSSPVAGKPSPHLNDYFAVELRFLEV